MTGSSVRLTDSITQRPVKVTFVSPESPVPYFCEETPFDLLFLWLSFLLASLPSSVAGPVQGPGMEVRSAWGGRVGWGENGMVGGQERGSNPAAASPGLQGMVSTASQQQESTA